MRIAVQFVWFKAVPYVAAVVALAWLLIHLRPFGLAILSAL